MAENASLFVLMKREGLESPLLYSARTSIIVVKSSTQRLCKKQHK
jgi:hypothetical protein